jgi:hypothetical protein
MNSLSRIPETQQIDSLNVVKQVEQYRQWWKPSQACVYLLGESHVSTREEDFALECKRYQNDIIPNYPTHYVRAVYCLGSGEPSILNGNMEDNHGTSQFWKIFSSCIATDYKKLGFEKILRRETPNTFRRLLNKVNILKEMQKKGIWLMDASIIGIYRTKENFGWDMNKEVKDKIIETCWDFYIKNQIVESQPKHIIVIGKGVEKILERRLELLKSFSGIAYSVLPQPQGNRGTSEEQLDTYREYQRICSKYAY